MNIPPIILKKVSGYVSTFALSLTIESLYGKELLRKNIAESIITLSSEHQAMFCQYTLDGLQQLQEELTSDEVSHESTLDNIEIEILKMQSLLEEHNHHSINSRKPMNSPGVVDVKTKKTLKEKQDIAREYIQFLGGVNLKNELIMSPKEYRNLLEYTDYLIQGFLIKMARSS